MTISIDEMAAFCKRKGFIYPSAEIYGGLAGFFDYGHLGVELKNNIKASFWQQFVRSREDVVGIDGSLITNKKVWEASGHVGCFQDIMLECTKCKTRVRGDQLIEEELNISAEGISVVDVDKVVKQNKLKCQKCGSIFGNAHEFNLMFKTHVGPVVHDDAVAYLRPETAQMMFTNFKLVQDNARMKLPFGIAQIGKAFRNEISPRDFLFRSREFELMEIEFFAHPEKLDDCADFNGVKGMDVQLLTAADQDKKKKSAAKVKLGSLVTKKLATQWHAYWLGQIYQWFLDLGIKKENLRLREHKKDELAHYAGACFDIEYQFPFGWKEIHGNADRKDFDLQQHIKHSKTDLSHYDEESKQKVVPYVAAEPAQGVDRLFLAFLFDAYDFDMKKDNVVLHLHPKLAPVQIGVFPLMNKLKKDAKNVFDLLKEEFVCVFDTSGSVGRRYARNDEIGTPYCITYDFDSLNDKAVTIRERDTAQQVRVPLASLKETLRKLFNKEMTFSKAGKAVKT